METTHLQAADHSPGAQTSPGRSTYRAVEVLRERGGHVKVVRCGPLTQHVHLSSVYGQGDALSITYTYTLYLTLYGSQLCTSETDHTGRTPSNLSKTAHRTMATPATRMRACTAPGVDGASNSRSSSSRAGGA